MKNEQEELRSSLDSSLDLEINRTPEGERIKFTARGDASRIIAEDATRRAHGFEPLMMQQPGEYHPIPDDDEGAPLAPEVENALDAFETRSSQDQDFDDEENSLEDAVDNAAENENTPLTGVPKKSKLKTLSEDIRAVFNTNPNTGCNNYSSIFLNARKSINSHKPILSIESIKAYFKDFGIFILLAIVSGIVAVGNWNGGKDASENLYSGIGTFGMTFFAFACFYTNAFLYINNLYNFVKINKWRALDWSSTSELSRRKLIAIAVIILVCGLEASFSPGVINATVAQERFAIENNGAPLTLKQQIIVYFFDGVLTAMLNGPLHLMFLAGAALCLLLPSAHAEVARNLELAASEFAKLDRITQLKMYYEILQERDQDNKLLPHRRMRCHIATKVFKVPESTFTLTTKLPEDFIPNTADVRECLALITEYESALPHNEQVKTSIALMKKIHLRLETATEKNTLNTFYYLIMGASFLGSILANTESLKKFVVRVTLDKMPELLNYLGAVPGVIAKQAMYCLSAKFVADLFYGTFNRLRGGSYFMNVPIIIKFALFTNLLVAGYGVFSGISFGDATGTDYEKIFDGRLQEGMQDLLGDWEKGFKQFLIYYAWSCAAGVNVASLLRTLNQKVPRFIQFLAKCIGRELDIPGINDLSEVFTRRSENIRARAFAPDAARNFQSELITYSTFSRSRANSVEALTDSLQSAVRLIPMGKNS